MKRVLSTYLFREHRLTTALLGDIERAGIGGVELFCARSHFDYRSSPAVREISEWLKGHGLRVESLHAPTTRETSGRRENTVPISLSDVERVRRLDAVEETKRALDIADAIPYRYLVQHLGTSRDPMTPQQQEAAMNSLEHLCLYAKQRGVTIALENVSGEFAAPATLRAFVTDTHLPGLRLCFDTGHAHAGDGVTGGFEAMRDLVVTTHVHDNHGENDEHLLPYQGTIDWDAAMAAFRTAPCELPIVFEIRSAKESAAHAEEQNPLAQAVAAFERLERAAGRVAAD
jgi:sugar phosphate isomerase/epimerase